MFKTPALEELWLTWYLQPTQFPDGAKSGSEEFITDRLIEDIADGRSSVALVVLETKMPDMMHHRVGQDVGVQFKILCTKDTARELIELGYKVQDRDEPDEEDQGLTWQEFLSLVNGRTRDRRDLEQWDKPMRLTDDNDPNAPWFMITGIKEDDDGYFVAIEEIQV